MEAFEGQVNTGGVLFPTVALNVHVEIFPLPSVTLIVTNVVTEMLVPETGVCVFTNAPLAVQLSDAVTRPL